MASSSVPSTEPTTTSTSEAGSALNPLTSHPVFSDPSAQKDAVPIGEQQAKLKKALHKFADFPMKGINFVDIMPLFADVDCHNTLLDILVSQALSCTPEGQKPDVIVGLDARGFLFGPGLALRLGVGFAPVRKKGKLPGPCVTAAYDKEYGTDFFQMQENAVKPGQNILIVDDIIATGGSAKAAAELVQQLGGKVLACMFILEIEGLNGRAKLEGLPISILLDYV